MNGGASDPWAKKPTLPDKLKSGVLRKTIDRPSAKKFCDQCLISGIKSPVQLFQLNDEEALLMCKNEDCTYMPSSNWGDLVVRRHISQINRSSSRKTRPWSLPSSSASSKHAFSVQSAPQRLQLPQKVHSKSSTPCLVVKPHLSPLALESPKLKSFPRHSEERVVSPTPSLDSSASDEPEQKTLVPIAPFLCRHAHSFASFETKTLESNRHQEESSSGREAFTNWNLTKSHTRGLKRRGSSLDSDSLSSCSSSLDSRPASPIESSVKAVGAQTSLNPTKKVVLSAEAVSKLQKGSCKLKLIKDAEGRTTKVILVPLPSQGNHNLISVTPQTEHSVKVLEDRVNSTSHVENGLELNSRQQGGPINQQTHTSDSKSSSAVSIQTHIDAINEHLAALSAAVGVNGSEYSLPIEISRLIPQAPNNSASLSRNSPESLAGSASSVSTNSELQIDNNSTGLPKESSELSLPHENSYDYSELDEYFIDNFTT